jgi:hypothetical protein
MSADEGTDRSWLLNPIGADEVRIHIDVGENVEISDEARAALDTLLEELYSEEVSGFASKIPCSQLSACKGRYQCDPLGKCGLLKVPCFADVYCKITKTPY